MNFVKINRLKGIANNVFSVDVNSKNRQADIIEARATCYTIMRKELHMGFAEIGKHFLKNHATILHGVKEFPYMVKFRPALKEKYKVCLSLFKTKNDLLDTRVDVVDTVLIKKSLNNLHKSNILLSLAIEQLQHDLNKLKKLTYKCQE